MLSNSTVHCASSSYGTRKYLSQIAYNITTNRRMKLLLKLIKIVLKRALLAKIARGGYFNLIDMQPLN